MRTMLVAVSFLLLVGTMCAESKKKRAKKSNFMIERQAPSFSADAVVDGQERKINLEDYKGSFVVVFFYPKDFTFVCPTELHALQDKLAEFKKRQAVVLAISSDTAATHKKWLNTEKRDGGIAGITFPLISDKTKAIARKYGVLDEKAGLAYRGYFIIDPEGVVQALQITGQSVGRSVDEILRLLDAIQLSKKSGDVCPANWRPGKQTMVPTQQGVVAYFKEQM